MGRLRGGGEGARAIVGKVKGAQSCGLRRSASSAAGRGLGPLLSIPRQPRQRRRVGHFPGGGEAGLEFLHICILRRRPLEPR